MRIPGATKLDQLRSTHILEQIFVRLALGPPDTVGKAFWLKPTCRLAPRGNERPDTAAFNTAMAWTGLRCFVALGSLLTLHTHALMQHTGQTCQPDMRSNSLQWSTRVAQASAQHNLCSIDNCRMYKTLQQRRLVRGIAFFQQQIVARSRALLQRVWRFRYVPARRRRKRQRRHCSSRKARHLTLGRLCKLAGSMARHFAESLTVRSPHYQHAAGARCSLVHTCAAVLANQFRASLGPNSQGCSHSFLHAATPHCTKAEGWSCLPTDTPEAGCSATCEHVGSTHLQASKRGSKLYSRCDPHTHRPGNLDTQFELTVCS